MGGAPADAGGAAYAAIRAVGERELAAALAAGRRGPVDELARLAAAGAARLPGGGRGSLAAVLTSVLHYLLTAAGVPSQRKASAGGLEVDVAVPGMRALAADPRTAAVICVAGLRPAPAAEQAAALAALQPHPENVWVVDEGPAGGRTYSVRGGTFGRLVFDAAEMAAASGAGRLRVLGAGHPGGPARPPP